MVDTLTKEERRKNARFEPIFIKLDEAIEAANAAIEAVDTVVQGTLDAGVFGDITNVFTGTVPILEGYEARLLYQKGAANCGVEIQANADQALAESCCIGVGRSGSGTMVISTKTGVSLNGVAGPQTAQFSLDANGIAFLFQPSTDVWICCGNVT